MKISLRRRFRLFWKRNFALVCFAVPLLLCAYRALRIEPSLLRECDRTVAVADLTPELDGFTIAVVSDLHLNDLRRKKLSDYAACINRRAPDLIVLLGDMVNSPPRPGAPPLAGLSQWLRSLHARYGICGVLGNHDAGYGAERVGAALEAGGCRVLSNTALRVGPEPHALRIIGIDYRNPSLDQSIRTCRKLLDKECVNILLTHAPDIFAEQPPGIALTLAGHTHGGQVALPFYGPLLRYSRCGRRFVYGHLREADGRQMIVTGGLGSTRDIRFGMAPEIVFVKLVPAKSAK